MSIETVALRMGFRADQALALEQACILFGIDTPLRVAHFLAQVAHESGTGQWMRELWGPTPTQKRYEGRADLGNTQTGDGRRFAGRGLIQLTGRANYTAYSQALYGDMRVVSDPTLVAVLPDAALAAGWFWGPYKHINPLADRDNLEAVTRRVNGGLNGLDDRRQKLSRAKSLYRELGADL